MTTDNIHLGIYPLSYIEISSHSYLYTHVYPNMYKNYYWSDDFSPEYYIAQAKSGFIAVTDIYKNQELLLPEIQYRYALLDFENLHISKKVAKLIKRENLQIKLGNNIDTITSYIDKNYKNNWLSQRYSQTLKNTENVDNNFKIITVYIEKDQLIVAGEIGYIIGNTYTSLSGFRNKNKKYNHYGTAQLVLLAQYLQENHFSFWNLGQPYMDYKQALGAKIYERKVFLKRWFKATLQHSF